MGRGKGKRLLLRGSREAPSSHEFSLLPWCVTHRTAVVLYVELQACCTVFFILLLANRHWQDGGALA